MFSNCINFVAMTATALIVARGVTAGNVCSPGQIAVGYEVNYVQDPGAPSTPYYSGFEMTNGCRLISQNGQTSNRNQMCSGGYFSGADITCTDPEHVTAAKDTSGNSYTCTNSGYDTSCDVTSGLTSFFVSGCCSRN